MVLRTVGMCAALVAALFFGMGCGSQPGGEDEPVVTGPPPDEPEEEALMPDEAVIEPGAEGEEAVEAPGEKPGEKAEAKEEPAKK